MFGNFLPRYLLVISLLRLSSCGRLDDAAKTRIDALANQLIDCRDIVGMNLAVVQDGNTLYSNGYGVIDRYSNTPVTDTSLFGVASVSKSFSSTLLGHVLSKYSQYTWDTAVRDILGEEMVFPTADMTEQTTVRDILAHRTGLSKDNRIRMDPGLDREELVRRIRFLTPVKPYKTSYFYNNLMYGLASRVTEVAGGKSWEQLMQQEIFDPLGMISTSFTHVHNMTGPDVAKPYTRTHHGEWRRQSLFLHSEWGKLGGSGSILSNARDMTKWIQLHLTHGMSSQGQEVVERSIIEDTHTPHNVIPETDRDRQYVRPQAPVSYVLQEYGLGWKTGFYRGYPLVSHTGTSWGYGALLTLVPALNIGIHTSVSGTDPGYRGRRALHMFIMDLLMDEEPWVNSSNVCLFPRPNTPPNIPSSEPHTSAQPLSHYTGRYGNFAYGNITVELEERTQAMYVIYGTLGKWKLQADEEGGNVFTGVGQDHMWSSSVYDVVFADHDDHGDEFQQVTLTSLDRDAPPTFRRGLRADQAPPALSLPCDTSPGNRATPVSVIVTALVIFHLIVHL